MQRNLINHIKKFYILRLLVFWLFLFAIFRILFIAYNYSKIEQGLETEVLLSFVYGLRLDIAMASIVCIVPFVLWSLQQFINSSLINNVNKVFNISLIVVIAILSISNVKLYKEWEIQLTARALGYVLYPEEMLAFISTKELIVLFSLLFLTIFLFVRVYNKFVTGFSASVKKLGVRLSLVAVVPGMLIIGARGGVQLAPINESSSYYSEHSFNNHTATNNIWFLLHSIEDAMKSKNIYHFMDDTTAVAIKQSLFLYDNRANRKILKTERPNIVFIILESWTADIIETLGGEKGVTPHFDELRKEGLLFTHMYSSGSRTEQGLVSIFSGFPAQPNHSIITTPSKAEQLPCILKDYKKERYATSFYYGGEIEFANMKSYLLHNGVEKIIDKHNFGKEQLNSKWGAHDEYVFSRQIEDLKEEKTPFFSIVLTLSTHEPFEVTMETPFTGKEVQEKFKKAAYYTDNCLRNYFAEAKKQAWYNNTLFILVADHGHHYPMNRSVDSPEGHRITAMLYGNVLTDSLKGKTIESICNQNDLPAIILAQTGLKYDNYQWSKNSLDSTSRQFAYYVNENTLGWVEPRQNVVYSFTKKSVENLQGNESLKLNDTVLTEAKAYLQALNKQYLDY